MSYDIYASKQLQVPRDTSLVPGSTGQVRTDDGVSAPPKLRSPRRRENTPQGGSVSVNPPARQATDHLAKRGLISNMGHALYVGRELQKAEMALRYPKHFEYHQSLQLDFVERT